MKNFKKLSREELKLINGGVAATKGIAEDSGPSCGAGRACSVTIISGGTTITNYGTCSMTQSGNYVSCYCSATGGNSVTSNGGRSRCWS